MPKSGTLSELPAGLIDDGETPEEAAIRELREETGYEAQGVLDSSSVLANDPGPYPHSTPPSPHGQPGALLVLGSRVTSCVSVFVPCFQA